MLKIGQVRKGSVEVAHVRTGEGLTKVKGAHNKQIRHGPVEVGQVRIG